MARKAEVKAEVTRGQSGAEELHCSSAVELGRRRKQRGAKGAKEAPKEGAHLLSLRNILIQ